MHITPTVFVEWMEEKKKRKKSGSKEKQCKRICKTKQKLKAFIPSLVSKFWVELGFSQRILKVAEHPIHMNIFVLQAILPGNWKLRREKKKRLLNHFSTELPVCCWCDFNSA